MNVINEIAEEPITARDGAIDQRRRREDEHGRKSGKGEATDDVEPAPKDRTPAAAARHARIIADPLRFILRPATCFAIRILGPRRGPGGWSARHRSGLDSDDPRLMEDQRTV